MLGLSDRLMPTEDGLKLILEIAKRIGCIGLLAVLDLHAREYGGMDKVIRDYRSNANGYKEAVDQRIKEYEGLL